MARRLRLDEGGIVYHVLNRRVGRQAIFKHEEDYAAFEQVLEEAGQRRPMRVLAYCLMPNHWHLVLWPRQDGDLARYLQWLTTTHIRRWHAHHGTRGQGPLYQGRYHSFPVPGAMLALRGEHANSAGGIVARVTAPPAAAGRSRAAAGKRHVFWIQRGIGWIKCRVGRFERRISRFERRM